MPFIRWRFVVALLLLWNQAAAFADSGADVHLLSRQISRLITVNSAFPPEAEVVQSVSILTPPAQLTSLCAAPQLTIVGSNRRLTGTKSIAAQCGERRKFIQVSVSAEGKWWSAARTIKSGKVISDDDIVQHSGSLARLPVDGVLLKSAIIGQTATRAINKGQSIAQSQLRHSWLALAGQQVEILAQGNGFQVRSRGKALNNAAANGPLKVSMGNGKIFSGVLSANGLVTINLQE